MAQQQKRVNPGDLITADFMNDILERIEKLEDAAVVTPGDGPMAITFPFPSAQLHLGDQLHIIGRGFGVPSSNTVSIDGATQTVEAGGSDTELVLNIKNVQNLGSGKTVTLLVSNTKGTASTQFTLLPFEQTLPTGSLTPFMSKPPADAKIVGRAQPYQFIFTIKAITSLPEDYLVETTVDKAGWTATPVDSNDKALTQVPIPKSDPPSGSLTEVRVNVVVPLNTPNDTVGRVTFKATSKKNPDLSNSGFTDVKVNNPPPVAQDKVVVTFTKTLEGNASIAGDVVEIKKGGGDVTLFCKAFIKQNGNYVVTASFDNATGWTQKPVANFNAQGATAETPSQNDVDVTIAAPANGNAVETNLNVKVALQSDPNNIFGQIPIKIRPK
jgi:hypothetical protein